MPHPLAELVRDVRRRARRLLVLHGLAWVLGCTAGVVLLLGGIDYLLRLEDRGVRAVSSLTALSVIAWAIWRFLRPALAQPLGDVAMAQRIERSYPQLGERLASAMEFLGQPDEAPLAGSAALRRAVVVDAAEAVGGVNVRDVVRSRPVLRDAVWPLAIGAVALACVGWQPQAARLAVAHLVAPWQAQPWPKMHDLALVDPVDRVGRGQAFEARVIDRQGPLPAEVRLHLRVENSDGTITSEVERMLPLAGAMILRRESVSRPFRYRAEGGDDQTMPWQTVEVVDPPQVESMAIQLHPPAYTGWLEESSGRRITALVGSTIALQATASKPLASVTLKLESGAAIPCTVSADHRSFSLAAEQFAVERSTRYWFELHPEDGLVGGSDDRWDLQAVTDSPPSISLEEPVNNLLITPTATLAIRLIAKDNIALQTVALVYSRSDHSEQGELTLPLFERKESPSGGSLATIGDGERRVLEYRWPLAPLELKPGTHLSFHIQAGDYKPQQGQSDQRQVTIISADDFKQRLANKQTFFLAELRRVLKMQQDARGQITGLLGQLQDVRTLRQPDVNQMQAAELSQRQISRSLVSPGEGLLPQIRAALAELRDNNVDSPETARQLGALADEIARIGHDHLPIAESELTAAVKTAENALAAATAQQSAASDPLTSKSLAAAGAQQDAVVAALEKLLGDFSQWANYREFVRDVSQIRHDLQELAEQSKQQAAAGVGQQFRELTPQQQADLKQLAARQANLARRFDKTQQNIRQAADQLTESNPLAATTLSDGWQAARDQAISNRLLEIARNLEANQLGQALQRQAGVDQSLAEMLDILSGRREHELSRLVAKLRAAEKQLSDLQAKQHALRSKLKAAAELPDDAARRQELKRLELKRLALEEQALQAELQRFARQLQRLQSPQAAQAIARASSKSGESSQAGEQADGRQAESLAAQAGKELDDAQQQLAQRRQQAEDDLAQEQLARIQDALQGLLARQQRAIEETVRLEDLKTSNGQLTRAEARSVQELGRDQAALAAETDLLAEKIAAAEVFKLALQSAAEHLRHAAELLAARDTGAVTQTAEQAALTRFKQLQQALRHDPPKAEDQPDKSQQPGDKKPDQPGDGIPNLAQLKLLKLMQEDLLARTRLAEAAGANRRQLLTLSQEQGQLADLLIKLTKQPVAADPDDDLNKMLQQPPSAKLPVTPPVTPPVESPPSTCDKESP